MLSHNGVVVGVRTNNAAVARLRMVMTYVYSCTCTSVNLELSRLSAVTTSRPRSRRGSGEELREALIVATSALLDTHQLDDLTVRTVTAATGVSPTALYLHFSDLDALVHEVKKRFFATLGDRLRAADDLRAM